MRRVSFVGVLFVVALVLAGCGTQPPAGYRLPVIDSVQVSPQPVSAGGTVTIVVEASDDVGVTGGWARRLVTPDGIGFGNGGLVYIRPVRTGARRADHHHLPGAGVHDERHVAGRHRGLRPLRPPTDYPFQYSQETKQRVPFEVVDGTEDHSPPQLVHYETEPATITQATTFTLTIRVRDEALPANVATYGSMSFFKQFSNYSEFFCNGEVVTPVSSTDVDLTWTCSPRYYGQPGPTEVGPYRAAIQLTDALGHEASVQMFVNALPA